MKVNPMSEGEIFIGLKTTVRPTKDKKEDYITLNFQPQKDPNVDTEPSNLTFHYSIHPPMKGWQKLVST